MGSDEGKPFKKELRLIRDDIEMFAFGWIIRKYGSIDIYVEHSVVELVLAPMQIEYEKENPVEEVENPGDGFENPVDGVENSIDDGVGNPVEEVEMPGNGDDAEIDEGDDVQVDHEERVIDDAINVEDFNEDGRKDGEEPSVKKSKDKRLEFLNESGYFVEVENSSGCEDDEETKYARRGFRQAKYQMLEMPGMHDWNVGEEYVGPQPQPPPYRGQASTSVAAASTTTSSKSMGVNPDNQELNHQQSRQKEPVKRKTGAANASVSHTLADAYVEFSGFGACTASVSFAADAPAKVSASATTNANRTPRPVSAPISENPAPAKAQPFKPPKASSSSNHVAGKSSARDVENLGRHGAASNPKRKASSAAGTQDSNNTGKQLKCRKTTPSQGKDKGPWKL
ncbi:hypothetical protein COLO4_07680 [Corchorus olitorius]|uniref:Uncharacterized protein n=1 Tax=Corchorus olitorius TaxID=93759 RepID=A0A1R3KIW8_9ROSI|nr:hypothetical protein COLO4_07680 [Corchorus olitorius]